MTDDDSGGEGVDDLEDKESFKVPKKHSFSQFQEFFQNNFGSHTKLFYFSNKVGDSLLVSSQVE